VRGGGAAALPAAVRHHRAGDQAGLIRSGIFSPAAGRKARTLVRDPQVPHESGSEITVNNDSRITRVGRWLRQWKLDELPQLLDVLYGDMSLVGPRPEVPKYVAVYPDDVRDVVLSVRPGITDLASIRFRDENAMLDSSSDPDTIYREQILPEKLKLQMEYVTEQSFATDMKILLQTASRVVRP